VSVVITAAADGPAGAPALVAVGPLRVSSGSRPLLVAASAIALLVLAALALLLVRTARRLGALERTLQGR
jgi:hypothetical protein